MKSFRELVLLESKGPVSDEPVIKGRLDIAKSDDARHEVFGWASIAVEEDGKTLVDLYGDMIEQTTLENAAYNYVRVSRDGGEMHERGGVATLIESMVFTPEKTEMLGIPDGTLPKVGWWVGFKVLDQDVWEKVKDGTYPMFSIEGKAKRVEAK